MLSVIKRVIPAQIKAGLREQFFKVIKPPAPFPLDYRSYSQAGEDRILSYLFVTMGIKNPSYLDIGANHPVEGNNSYLFYEKGGTGVCVEADPSLFEDLSSVRKNDKCL